MLVVAFGEVLVLEVLVALVDRLGLKNTIFVIITDLLHEGELVVVFLLSDLADNHLPILDHRLRNRLSLEVPVEQVARLDEVLTVCRLCRLLNFTIFGI